MRHTDKPVLTKKENAVQVFKFVLFSISAGLIQACAFTLMKEVFRLPYSICYFTALALSVVWNFTLNRRFTFKSANNVPVAMLKVCGYYCVFTPLSTWWGSALAAMGVNEYLVLFGTMLVNLATEFLFNRFVVFRNSINTNELAQKDRGEKSA